MNAATQDRLINLLIAVGLTQGAANAVTDALFQRYGEAHRHYHNLEHMDHLLSSFDRIGNGSPAIELAIWFHDSVYDPRANDNELKSAEFFAAAVESASDPKLLGDVRRLILATDPRRDRSGMGDENLIIDLDLGILASCPEYYDQYRSAIRAEYGFVDRETFARGRIAVLRRILDRPIYATDALQALEAVARSNLEREIAMLEAGLES